MFDLFKKKEDNQANGLKRDRIGRNVRRPKTAPADCLKSPKFSDHPIESAVINFNRHSADGQLRSQRAEHGSPEPLSPSNELSTSHAALNTELRPVPSRPTLGRPLVPNRSLSTASCELRNPFRSDTSDSITTISMSRASSFGEAVIPVERSVLTRFPEQTEGTTDLLPHKAAIFTTSSRGLGISVNPFSDENSETEDSDLSTTPTTISSIHSAMQQDSPSTTLKRNRWSFLKSPKHATQDFLQVDIPSSVLSPPARHRHAFWARA